MRAKAKRNRTVNSLTVARLQARRDSLTSRPAGASAFVQPAACQGAGFDVPAACRSSLMPAFLPSYVVSTHHAAA